MAADDYRVSIGAQHHPKIVKLVRRCEYHGWWSLTNIWRHAAVCKPLGRLTGMTIEDIEIAGDWDPKRPGELVSTLVDIRLLDLDGDTYVIHDWAENNPWVAGSPERSEHARQAANARHARKRAAQLSDEQCSDGEGAVLGAESGNAPLLSASDSSPKPDPKNIYSPDFEKAWAKYPKRQGDNSKPDAFKAWKARVNAGERPGDMLAGVQRYAAFCDATHKTGTEFVKQGRTFFGPSKHWKESWEVNATTNGNVSTLPRSSRSIHVNMKEDAERAEAWERQHTAEMNLTPGHRRLVEAMAREKEKTATPNGARS